MNRKIRFLGTGAGDFIQEASPYNPPDYAEKIAGITGRDFRRAASTLLGDDILIDHNSDVVFRDQDIDPSGIRHLLITHGHFDHLNPLAICELAPRLKHPLTIYGSVMTAHSMEFAATHRWDAEQKRTVRIELPSPFTMQVIRPFASFSIGDLQVTPVPANHSIQKRYMLSDHEAFNFIIEDGGRTLFYGLDSSELFPETWEFLQSYQFDVCVLDGTFGYREIDPFLSGHLNFNMLSEMRDAFREAGLLKPDARIFADHISVQYAEIESHDIAAAELEKRGVVLTYDGLEVEL